MSLLRDAAILSNPSPQAVIMCVCILTPLFSTSVAYFKNDQTGPEILPNLPLLTTVKPQSCPDAFSVSTDVTQTLPVSLQSAAEGTGGVRKGSELLEGFCLPRRWKGHRVWRRGRPHPSILRNPGNGDRRPHPEHAVSLVCGHYSPSILERQRTAWTY